MESKLYVGNLPYETTEDELRTLFTQVGTVESVDVIKDRETGRSKGFAFVVMGSQAEMEQAIQRFNNYQMGSRALTVNVARPKQPRSQGGYGNKGQGNRQRDNRGGSRR